MLFIPSINMEHVSAQNFHVSFPKSSYFISNSFRFPFFPLAKLLVHIRAIYDNVSEFKAPGKLKRKKKNVAKIFFLNF